MEVRLSPEIEQKLNLLASQQGCDVASIVHDAVEQMLEYDSWYRRKVQEGIAAADRGELIEDEEIAKLIEERYPG